MTEDSQEKAILNFEDKKYDINSDEDNKNFVGWGYQMDKQNFTKIF